MEPTMKIESKTISWKPSTSSDVAKYRVRCKPDDGSGFAYGDAFVETTNTQIVAPDDFPDGTFSSEGSYLVGVSAVDDQGNESDIAEITHPFDFVPPKPPTGLSVS
jgi:hypothetical protein